MSEATVHITTLPEPYKTIITASGHSLIADEPLSEGGGNTGPNPYEYLLSALGVCTAITVRMYANRKEWPLEKVAVELELIKQENKTEIIRNVTVFGNLSDEQKERLLKIANACPVHKILTQPISISTRLS